MVGLTKTDDEPWPDFYWLPSDESIDEPHITVVQNFDGKWNAIRYVSGLARLTSDVWSDEPIDP